MLIAVAMLNNNDEPCVEYVDTDKLDKNDFVDMEVLKAVEDGETYLEIDQTNWGEISAQANVEKPDKLDAVIIVSISFE